MAFSLRVFILLCGIGGVFGVCPLGWTLFDSNCYIYQNVPKTFQAAEAACTALHPSAHLVSIYTVEENNQVKNLITVADPWIGLNDTATDGCFVWTVGQTVALLPFADQLPQIPNGMQECVYIAQTDGKWHADTCNVLKPYVCKRP
ncbi:alpha-N-acetylgalactosamine-specific lectin-like [Entelurus aequoreus]|uniref:alpha-N-acetylgalactosamine-specific lectin-like n=1 Tax=Entelurus aequoreus TaxID=161455 RepID=UPI002B1D3291|nr:alpha-N-acetylgalactosamine-specific lectin-like [Entelurus aequoreus]